jgi:xanthine dehydrogenase small subunit
LPLKDLYVAYKKLAKTADESIVRILFEALDKHTFFNFEKVCKRTNLDIASVNSAVRISVENDVITEAHLSAGGVGPTPKYLAKTAAFLIGKSVSNAVVAQAADIAQSEISPISDVRGSETYKRLLLRQLIFAHFLTLFPKRISFGELV